MNLYALRKLIGETWSDHWNLINDGPQYNYNLGTINDVATVTGWHHARAVLTEDVDVALEFGMTDDPFGHRENWRADWAPFADPKVSGEYCDVFYRGALVDRVHLVSVDGGRAILPLPHHREGQWTVMDWDYTVARLVDDLTGHREFATYFENSGIYKWPA
jgi:hypothetical protein